MDDQNMLNSSSEVEDRLEQQYPAFQSLLEFKKCLDNALRQIDWSLGGARSWDSMVLMGPFQLGMLYVSVIVFLADSGDADRLKSFILQSLHRSLRP